MIRKSTESETNRTQLEMVTLDELVPADHLVRKIEAVIDFKFIYPLWRTYILRTVAGQASTLSS